MRAADYGESLPGDKMDLVQMMLDCAETMTSVLDDVTDMSELLFYSEQWELGSLLGHVGGRCSMRKTIFVYVLREGAQQTEDLEPRQLSRFAGFIVQVFRFSGFTMLGVLEILRLRDTFCAW